MYNLGNWGSSFQLHDFHSMKAAGLGSSSIAVVLGSNSQGKGFQQNLHLNVQKVGVGRNVFHVRFGLCSSSMSNLGGNGLPISAMHFVGPSSAKWTGIQHIFAIFVQLC